MKLYIATCLKDSEADTDNIFVLLPAGKSLVLFTRPTDETKWKATPLEQDVSLEDWQEQWKVREITEMEVESMVLQAVKA
jgi:hypothetical protein